MVSIYITGCYSKINTCSEWKLGNISDQSASNKLGLKNGVEEYGFDGIEGLNVSKFCDELDFLK